MRLLVIRHAQAVPPGAVPDADRALTPQGARRFREAAAGLARLVPTPDALWTSPLLRARETAALAGAAWGIEPAPKRVLASGGVDAIVARLEQEPQDATIVLVGHEPTVSMLVAQLAGMSDALAFEPGAAALVEIDSLAARNARLVWFLPPAAAAAVDR